MTPDIVIVFIGFITMHNYSAHTIHDQLKVMLMIDFTYQKQLTVKGNGYFQLHSSLDNNLWDHCTSDNI